jgi:hypothetical protein
MPLRCKIEWREGGDVTVRTVKDASKRGKSAKASANSTGASAKRVERKLKSVFRFFDDEPVALDEDQDVQAKNAGGYAVHT